MGCQYSDFQTALCGKLCGWCSNGGRGRRGGCGTGSTPEGWERIEAKVIKEGRKYKLWYPGRFGNVEYTLKGKYLDCSHSGGGYRLTRVP